VAAVPVTGRGRETINPGQPTGATGAIEGTGVSPGQQSSTGYEIVQASREFHTLRRRFVRIAIPVTALFLGWYFLYVIVAAFAPGFMRIKVIGDLNIGLCFGAMQFVSTFGLTAFYARWARRNIDPVASRLKNRAEKDRRW
jgi:uncharacterized membrane protein (DUF485 family)